MFLDDPLVHRGIGNQSAVAGWDRFGFFPPGGVFVSMAWMYGWIMFRLSAFGFLKDLGFQDSGKDLNAGQSFVYGLQYVVLTWTGQTLFLDPDGCF